MRLLALVAVLLVVAAPARAGAAGSSRTGVLHGAVTRGAACTPGGPPCGQPVPGIKIVFLSHGRPVAHTTTIGDGTYRIRLRAGRYGIRLPGHTHVQPSHAQVVRGQVTRLDIAFDALT